MAVTLALTLYACQTSSPSRTVNAWRWDKPEVTEETFMHDRYYCLQGATTRDAMARYLDRTQIDPDRFATCMGLRGYTRSEGGRFGSPAAPPSGGTPRS